MARRCKTNKCITNQDNPSLWDSRCKEYAATKMVLGIKFEYFLKFSFFRQSWTTAQLLLELQGVLMPQVQGRPFYYLYNLLIIVQGWTVCILCYTSLDIEINDYGNQLARRDFIFLMHFSRLAGLLPLASR